MNNNTNQPADGSVAGNIPTDQTQQNQPGTDPENQTQTSDQFDDIFGTSQQTPSGQGDQSMQTGDKQTVIEGPSLKERQEQLTQLISKEEGQESVKFKEFKEVEIGPEVKDWMEKIETGDESRLAKPVIDDFGQILLQNSQQKKPKIVLPLEEEEIRNNLKINVADSVRWLAEWCLRIIKSAGKRVTFKSTQIE